MKSFRKIKFCWPAGLSALLLALTLPPFNLGLLAFVALAPWLAYLRFADSGAARQSGAWFGALLFLSQTWFIIVLLFRWTGSPWLGMIPWLMIGALAGLVYSMIGWVLQIAWQRGLWFLLPLLWAGTECFRANFGIIAFPWAQLAHGLWPYPFLIQSAAWGTVWMVSAWCVLPTLLAVFWIWPNGITRDSLRPDDAKDPGGQVLFRVGMVFILVLFASFYRFLNPNEIAETRVVTIGQPGVDLAYLRGDERWRQIQAASDQAVLAATRQNSRLVVMPEGYAPGGNLPPNNSFGPMPLVPVLFGGAYTEDGVKLYQSAFLWDGQDWEVTPKVRLVPYGEYVPFRQFIPPSFKLGFMDFEPGKAPKVMDWDGAKIGASICFEGLFPEISAKHSQEGAQLLTVLSMDEWYVDTPAWDQLWQSCIFRAVESGTPLVRSAGYGKSLAVNGRGQIIAEIRPRVQEFQRLELGIPAAPDGARDRLWFGWLCLALIPAVAVYEVIQRIRAKAPQSKAS